MQKLKSKILEGVSAHDQLQNLDVCVQVLVIVNALADRDEFVFAIAPKTVLILIYFSLILVVQATNFS